MSIVFLASVVAKQSSSSRDSAFLGKFVCGQSVSINKLVEKAFRSVSAS